MPRASRADLSSFASKVAQHLSGDWSSDYLSHPTYPDQFPRAEYIWDLAMVYGAVSTYVLTHDAILTGPDGIRLYVIDRPLHPEQFLVGAFAPDELKETYFWSNEIPHGIAVSSNPARAAHQITQRLLPRYKQAVARTEPPRAIRRGQTEPSRVATQTVVTPPEHP
ncbi:hypothetical protein ACFY0R_10100 [Streptomyces sp. NPDC001633]|uniref:hypothetical protein n=1 Tax=Streptomyces sp. NPDC001633 TaxID=3364595 RepID=UPI0036A454AC